RVLDHGVRLLGKQAIEPAIERYACHHGHQHGRHGRNDREQCNNAYMQACRGAAATSRLQDLPDLAQGDGREQQHRHRIRQEQRYDDFVRWCDRREARKNNEGYESRQERECDRDDPELVNAARLGWCSRGNQRFSSGRLANLAHALSRPGRLFGAQVAPSWAAPLTCDLVVDAFLQQCCLITTIPGRINSVCGLSAPDRRFVAGGQLVVRNTWMSKSRIFLRKVFLLTPRRSAARIWFPRVAASVTDRSGCSTSRKIR